MKNLTVFGSSGYVGSEYRRFREALNVQGVTNFNERFDYSVATPSVLNFISTVHNYNVFDKPYLDVSTNLTLLIQLLEAWKEFVKDEDITDGVFTQVSSWFVYGKLTDYTDSINAKENIQCNPKGFYSITKYTSEQLLASYCETHNLKYQIVRLGNVIGGVDPKASAQKNALHHLVEKLKKNEPVEIYDDGMFFRDYIHVKDAVRAIELVRANGALNTIYNIGNGIPYRNNTTFYFKDLMYYLKDKLGSQSEITFKPTPEFHKTVQIKSFAMNCDKLRDLGFKPEYTGEKLWDSLI